MADGTIILDVKVNGKDIKITARDLEELGKQGSGTGKNLGDTSDSVDQLGKKSERTSKSIKDMALSMGIVKVASKAIGMIKNSLDSAISRFDTMQKFPKVMSALGFSAEDSSKSIKKLSDGIDGLPTKLDDVVAQTQQMTAITGNLDRSTDTVLALNNAFLASGADSEKASRGMEQFNKIISTGKVELDSWTTLQETMPLALQKTAEAMGFTGKTAQRDLYSALQKGKVSVEQFNDKLIELGTGTGMFASLAKENSLGIATSFSNLKNSIAKNVANVITSFDKLVQAVSGKSIAQNIDSLKQIINVSFTAINKKIEQMIPTFQKLGVFIKEHSTLFKALGISVSTFVGAIAGIASAAKAISLVRGAFVSLKMIMAANPFTLIVAGIAALAAGLMYLYKTNINVKNTIDNLFKSFGSLRDIVTPIVGIVKNLGKTVAENFSKVDFSKLGKAFNSLGKNIGNSSGIQGGLSKMTNGFNSILEGLVTNAPKLGKNFGLALKGIEQAIANALPSIVSGGLEIVAGFIQGVAKGIPTVAAAIAELVLSVTISMKTLIPIMVTSAGEIVTTFITSLTAQLPQILQVGANLIVTLLDGITKELPKLIDSAANLTLAFLQGVNAHLPEILQVGINILFNILQGISNNIGQVTSKAVEIIAKFLNGIAYRIDDVIDAGVKLVIAIINGIASRISEIVNAGMNLVDKLAEGVIQAQGRLMDAAIRLINGFANNIRSRQGEVRSAAFNLLTAIVGVFSPTALVDAGISIIGGFLQGMKSKYEEVKSFVGGIAGWIAEHKGPISYDKRLLIPAGQSIMDGLNNGLQSQFSKVKDTIAYITDSLNMNFSPSVTPNVRYPQLRLANLPNIESSLSLGYAANVGSSINTFYANSASNDTKELLEAIIKVANRPIEVQIDGKAIATATAQNMSRELASQVEKAAYRAGIR